MDAQTRRSRLRQIVTPLLILVVAGGITWWASQREQSRLTRMQTFVRQLCREAATGSLTVERLPARTILAEPVLGLLNDVCADADRTLTGVTVQIRARSEDDGLIGATHLATIERPRHQGVQLGLIEEGDGLIITGYERLPERGNAL